MRVLITGTSGFIGRALAENMAVEHEVQGSEDDSVGKRHLRHVQAMFNE